MKFEFKVTVNYDLWKTNKQKHKHKQTNKIKQKTKTKQNKK